MVQSKIVSLIHPKWEAVKEYYERSYKVRFRKRLPDAKVEELYKKMIQLTDEMKVHFFQKPGLKSKVDSSLKPQ